MLEVGTTAPEFCNPNQDNVEICLRDLKGKWIVLYFYPKDNTPGCTNEACDFTAKEAEFDGLDAVILGVSPDSPKKHQNFIEKQNLSITLLADEEKTLCEAYGVWQEKMNYGRKYMGVVRSTFIIDPEGKIAAVWENVKVRQKRKKQGETIETFHAEIVKEKLQELQA
jgi:thioredoxin-dependent peroxiredoxin